MQNKHYKNYKNYVIYLLLILFKNNYSSMINHDLVKNYFADKTYYNYLTLSIKQPDNTILTMIIVIGHIITWLKCSHTYNLKNNIGESDGKAFLCFIPMILMYIIRNVIAKKKAYEYITNELHKNNILLNKNLSQTQYEIEKQTLFHENFLKIMQKEKKYYTKLLFKAAMTINFLMSALQNASYSPWGIFLIHPLLYNLSIATKTFYDYSLDYYSTKNQFRNF